MSSDELAASMAAITDLSAYIVEQLRDAADHPRDDLVSELAGACRTGSSINSPLS